MLATSSTTFRIALYYGKNLVFEHCKPNERRTIIC
jgi:hypothetical protein